MAKSDHATSTGTIPTRRRVELVSPPAWIKPQLAKLVEKAPDGPDWLHEIKLDGYRMHARLDGGRVQILTRRGNDWTDKYPAIAEAIAGLPAQNAYLDGELCGVLPDGRTAFNLIQNATDTAAAAAPRARSKSRTTTALIFESSASMRAIELSTSSRDDTWRFASASTSSPAAR